MGVEQMQAALVDEGERADARRGGGVGARGRAASAAPCRPPRRRDPVQGMRTSILGPRRKRAWLVPSESTRSRGNLAQGGNWSVSSRRTRGSISSSSGCIRPRGMSSLLGRCSALPDGAGRRVTVSSCCCVVCWRRCAGGNGGTPFRGQSLRRVRRTWVTAWAWRATLSVSTARSTVSLGLWK